MAYCDTIFADAYLSQGAFVSKWTGTAKANFLEQATRFIKEFCYFEDEKGEVFRYDETDETAEIPVWLKEATCEEALYLITLGKDPTAADKKTTLGIVSTDGTVFDKKFAADVLCKACVRILENNGGIIDPDATASENDVTGGWFTK